MRVKTKISYNGQAATLTKTKKAPSMPLPLKKNRYYVQTGWQAPISQLPYWIQGQPAPSDANDKKTALIV